jgi:hypothetical protein
MELNDRETLVRVEQQLKDSVQNGAQIMSDLKEIFGRIERDSKLLIALASDFKSHLETSKFRWDDMEKKHKEFQVNMEKTEACLEENEKAIAAEREARVLFQQEVNSTVRTVAWIFGSLATLASIISGIILVMQIFGKMKGVG